MNCKNCNQPCCRWGRQKNGTQRFYCRACKKCQQSDYKYSAYDLQLTEMISKLVCESVSIRGIARVLKIAVGTVIKKIKLSAGKIPKPPIPFNCKVLELDEVRTYINRKENQYWIAYALCGETRRIIDFIVGKRTKRTLRMIVNTLLLSNVETIKTDKLNIYQSLIPARQHQSVAYNINHIERNNLNLRTHLKRLSRRTICFSRSIEMLTACLKIYFWGRRLLPSLPTSA